MAAMVDTTSGKTNDKQDMGIDYIDCREIEIQADINNLRESPPDDRVVPSLSQPFMKEIGGVNRLNSYDVETLRSLGRKPEGEIDGKELDVQMNPAMIVPEEKARQS